MQESAAWFTRVQVDCSELEDFAFVSGDDTQVQKDVPTAAQAEERAAADVQVQEVLVQRSLRSEPLVTCRCRRRLHQRRERNSLPLLTFRRRRRLMQSTFLLTPTCFKWKR